MSLESKILSVQEYLVRDLANIVRGYLEGLPDHIYLRAEVEYKTPDILVHRTVVLIDISPSGVISVGTALSLFGAVDIAYCSPDQLHPCTCHCC